jgi:hypothetical protein
MRFGFAGINPVSGQRRSSKKFARLTAHRAEDRLPVGEKWKPEFHTQWSR